MDKDEYMRRAKEVEEKSKEYMAIKDALEKDVERIMTKEQAEKENEKIVEFVERERSRIEAKGDKAHLQHDIQKTLTLVFKRGVSRRRMIAKIPRVWSDGSISGEVLIAVGEDGLSWKSSLGKEHYQTLTVTDDMSSHSGAFLFTGRSAIVKGLMDARMPELAAKFNDFMEIAKDAEMFLRGSTQRRIDVPKQMFIIDDRSNTMTVSSIGFNYMEGGYSDPWINIFAHEHKSSRMVELSVHRRWDASPSAVMNFRVFEDILRVELPKFVDEVAAHRKALPEVATRLRERFKADYLAEAL